MRAERALLEAYAEWRRLTEAARRAIRTRNWPLVLECHAVIAKLQPVITQLTRETKAEWRHAGADPAVGGKKLRGAVLELIKLIESNKTLMDSVRKRIESENQQQQRTVQNLKRLQQSYAAVQWTAWSSFS